MDKYSSILIEAYQQFLLPLGGKLVPTPYRRNEKGSFQKIGPEFQGKSSPETLIETTKRLAKRQKFDLDKASVEEIRNFMEKNKLGIDCSGFVYRILNYLTEQVKEKPLTALGFEHVGRTNVAKLTSKEFSIKIRNFKDAKSGDIIRLDSGTEVLHALVLLKRQNNILTYAHSSNITEIKGIHAAEIKNGEFPEDLKPFKFNEKAGDGIYRLKILQ